MERQFGFGSPFFFNPFFFPRRRFFPFFFISPFFFPFFREGDERDGMYSQHECVEGDTMRKLAKKYNVPQPILETMNPHLQNPSALSPGNVVNIPRLDKMYCQTLYMEQQTPASPMPYPAQGQQMTAYPHMQGMSPGGTHYSAVPPTGTQPYETT